MECIAEAEIDNGVVKGLAVFPESLREHLSESGFQQLCQELEGKLKEDVEMTRRTRRIMRMLNIASLAGLGIGLLIYWQWDNLVGPPEDYQQEGFATNLPRLFVLIFLAAAPRFGMMMIRRNTHQRRNPLRQQQAEILSRKGAGPITFQINYGRGSDGNRGKCFGSAFNDEPIGLAVYRATDTAPAAMAVGTAVAGVAAVQGVVVNVSAPPAVAVAQPLPDNPDNSLPTNDTSANQATTFGAKQFCTNCGAENPGYSYCSNCGQKQ